MGSLWLPLLDWWFGAAVCGPDPTVAEMATRRTARMHEQSAAWGERALHRLAQGWSRQLRLAQRVFAYRVLEHAEGLT